MRLRTELIDGVCCVSPSSVDGFDELRHDAAAAHALMKALGEYEGAENGEANIYAMRIHRRADELMQQWGYKNDDARK